MNRAFHVFCGLSATVLLAALSEVLPCGGLILVAAVVALALFATIQGTRLLLALRVFATAIIVYFAYGMCLVGRTMEPRFTPYTVSMALWCFGLFATVPTMALLVPVVSRWSRVLAGPFSSVVCY